VEQKHTETASQWTETFGLEHQDRLHSGLELIGHNHIRLPMPKLCKPSLTKVHNFELTYPGPAVEMSFYYVFMVMRSTMLHLISHATIERCYHGLY
jgi:hypothetical protein